MGYQTFLYYNECELRQVFMFLIETLPNESQKTKTIAPAKKRSLLMQDIASKIDNELKRIWIPPSCKSTSQMIGDFEVPSKYIKVTLFNLHYKVMIISF